MRYILGYAVRLAKPSDEPTGHGTSLITENSEPSSRGKRRHYITLAVFVFFSIVILLAVLSYSSFRWDLFIDTLDELDPRWLAAGSACILLSYFGRAVRWKVMMLPQPSRLGSIFSATLIGFSSIVFFGRAGEVVRPILIATREDSTVAAQAAVWILERLFDLLLILALFGIGLAESRSFDVKSGSVLAPILHIGGALVVLVAGATGAILYMFARHPSTCESQILKALSFLPNRLLTKVERTLGSFIRGAGSISKPAVMILSLLLTVVEWGIVLAAVWCFFHSHPAFRDFGMLEVAIYLGFVSIGNIVQLPGIGGGVQLISVVVLTELFHRPLEVATGLSLLIWAGLSLVVLPFGIALAMLGHLKIADIRRYMRGMGQEARL
ncbi:MAG TPA: lysylphosphatidylglycerol synthase transmembrane domain-containing protein [Bryobacteraceae bacterium]|nr:lysylphosphatidylglycerol synthase transmembrane domain-containing protein [Bryobacteraceae bacterium]